MHPQAAGFSITTEHHLTLHRLSEENYAALFNFIPNDMLNWKMKMFKGKAGWHFIMVVLY